jgi:hypothetical protein
MHPLTLPSRTEQSTQKTPHVNPSDCGHEHGSEHLIEVCVLADAEADSSNEEIFSDRWLELCWPFEEQEFDAADGLIFDESSETCLVAIAGEAKLL